MAVSQVQDFDFTHLQRDLKAAAQDAALFQAIVDIPFADKLAAASIFLGIIVFLQVDPANQTIDRIAISNTDMAEQAKQMSMKRFEDIRIPLSDPENILAQSLRTAQPQETSDWKYLFVPELSEEHARHNQADAGIAFSVVHPLQARSGGALIFSYFQPRELMGHAHMTFMQRYSQLVDNALAA